MARDPMSTVDLWDGSAWTTMLIKDFLDDNHKPLPNQPLTVPEGVVQVWNGTHWVVKEQHAPT